MKISVSMASPVLAILSSTAIALAGYAVGARFGFGHLCAAICAAILSAILLYIRDLAWVLIVAATFAKATTTIGK